MAVCGKVVNDVLLTLSNFLPVHFQKVSMRTETEQAVNLMAELVVEHSF